MSVLLIVLGFVLWLTVAPTLGIILIVVGAVALLFEGAYWRGRW